jgi:hypothetical protein
MVAALSYASRRDRRRVDDEDVLDDFDPAYFPRRVYKDGRGPTVRLMLTDAVPSARYDAHRPHQLVSDSAEVRDAEREAARAYDERNDFLRDAWRSRDNPPPPALRDGQSPRDQYIERVTSAWRAPPRRNDPADDIEALQRRWASPSDADQAYEEYCARLQAAWKTR